jgi:glycosyltransferase involved in cell wall biosynthesis
MLISIVIPVFNEADNLPQLQKRLIKILNEISYSYELIYINDGSNDSSLDVLKGILIPEVTVIDFSRNFGKESAISAGLIHAKGEVIIPIDSDLQHPPELIKEMVQTYLKGWDVVFASRIDRNGDSYMRRKLTNLFYKINDSITDHPLPLNSGDFRLMSRKVVDAINSLPEKNKYMKGIYSWVGFKTTNISYEVAPRVNGVTSFNLLNLYKLAINGLFNFTTLPLKIWIYIGLSVATFSFLYSIVILVKTLIFGIDTPGYASTIIAVLFMGGIQLIGIGVLGEYISLIFTESKQRPAYIIKDLIKLSKDDTKSL